MSISASPRFVGHNRQIELGSGPRSTADTGTSTIALTQSFLSG
jgi:hypothetical protein